MAIITAWRGDFAAAASLIAEAEAIAAATGSGFARYAAVFLAGFRGAEAEAWPLIEAVITDSRAAGQGVGVQWSQWVSAILYNGLGRYEEALAEAQQAAEQAPELFISMWALAELIEAASRTGQTAAGRGRARPAGRGDQHRPDRLGAGDLRALPGAAQRRPGRRGLVSRGRRPAQPHPPSSRARPRAPAVRRVAAPRAPPGRGAGAAAHRARDVRRDRHAGVRRAGPPRAAGHRRDRPHARRRHARRSSPRRRPRSPGWPGRACPTRRSPPSCSCPRAPSSTTWATSSPSSASPPAASFGKRYPAAPRRAGQGGTGASPVTPPDRRESCRRLSAQGGAVVRDQQACPRRAGSPSRIATVARAHRIRAAAVSGWSPNSCATRSAQPAPP